jgi:uncharacterized protein (DUF2236 family)
MTASPPVRGALEPDAPLPFGRDSVVRAVVAEPVTALLVQRALVMEVAHPKVAAAVAQHSQFQRRPLSRAWVTADAALRLVFGSEQVARGAARQIYGVHDHIHGRLDTPRTPRADDGADDGADAAARAYTAHDASLLVWVWATLVDSAETAFTRWVRPFDGGEADDYYDEMRSFARFLGIPDELLPADRDAFSGYLEDVLDSELLGASPQSWSLARQVLWFEHRVVLSPVVRLERVLALTTLDARVMTRLGLEASRADLDLGRRLDGWLSGYYRRLPRPPRLMPGLYVTVRRPSIGLAARVRGCSVRGAEEGARPPLRRRGAWRPGRRRWRRAWPPR